MTQTPPSASAGGYPPHMERDATYFQPYAAGDAISDSGPDTDEYPLHGHRSSRRPGALRRLLRKREEPEAGQHEAGQPEAGQPEAASPAADPMAHGQSWLADGAEGRSAEYRAQHRARHPAPPGYFGAPPPAAPDVQPPYLPGGGRADTDQAARDHLSPDEGAEPPCAEPGPWGPSSPSAGPTAAAPATPPVPPADPLYRVLGGLAMRDLTLVESLLQVVGKLETQEEDPEQLELLFRIDHLAARMRRNSENLLVLAGHDTEGRDFEPVPLLDVARAAVSEITDYSRAQVTSLPDVRVTGLAAGDLSHILAELLDNATSKSPQSAAVVVRGERTGDGTMVVSVEDAGIGIPADRLADINMRLGRPPVLDASATRHMGLYVVGRLAHPHGIRVQLRERPYGGITAHVIIPGELTRAAPGAPPSHTARPDQPRPRPQPSAPPAGRTPEPSAAPRAPGAAGAPAAPRFSPADPATLPRRAPGRPAPANGRPVTGLATPGEPSPPVQPAGNGQPERSGQPASPAQLNPGEPGPGLPSRPPSPVSAAREPGQVRAARIRDELAGFQLGQRAARAGEAAPGSPAPAAAPGDEPWGPTGGLADQAGPQADET